MNLLRSRVFYAAFALLALVLFVVANVHFVTVAGTSQPGCVEHVRPGQTGAAQQGFSAAGSSC